MGYTEDHLQALREALASGELSIQHNGRRIQYRSVAELKEAIDAVEDALCPGRRRVHRAIFDKGL
jgi:gpW.